MNKTVPDHDLTYIASYQVNYYKLTYILDDEIFDSYDEELMKKLIKISNGNGINFGEGLQRKDIDQIIQRLGRRRQIDENEI